MELLIILFVGFVLLIIFRWEKIKENYKKFPPPFSFPTQKLPYTKKKYLLTQAELQFFRSLQQAIGNQFYIFPQVRISDLLFIQASGRQWWKYFGKINQKSADFVLCEPQTLMPVLAIELNDSSHNQENRIHRDDFLQRAFSSAELPLLFMKCKYNYNPDELKNIILQKITIPSTLTKI